MQTAHLKIAYYSDTQLVAFFLNGNLMGSQNVNFKPLPSAPNAIRNKARTGLSMTNALYMLSVQGASKNRGNTINATFQNIVAQGLPLGYQEWLDDPGAGGLNWWNILATDYSQTTDALGMPLVANMSVRGTNSIPSQYDWDVFPGSQEPVGGIQMPAGIPVS